MGEKPGYLEPFVLPVTLVAAERTGNVDIYRPAGDGPAPAIVFVHGGPMPEQVRPTPRDWPLYQSWASLAAARGAVGVMLDHRLHDRDSYALAAADVAAAVELARDDAGVDGDRIALWFFSGGSPLLADWLRTPPPWLRCIAANYPVLGEIPGFPLDHRFRPAETVAAAGSLPIILTLVGQDMPPIAESQKAFVAAAEAVGARLKIIEVPDGHHSYEIVDDTDASREAIESALTAVMGALG